MKMESNRVILVGMAVRVNINDMQCSNGKKGRQKQSLKCLYTETLSQSHDSVGLHYLAWLRLCYRSLPPSHVFCHSCDSSTVWQCSVLITITVCAGEVWLAWTCCSVDGRIIISFHFGAPCVGNLLADKGHPKDGRIMVWSISILWYYLWFIACTKQKRMINRWWSWRICSWSVWCEWNWRIL